MKTAQVTVVAAAALLAFAQAYPTENESGIESREIETRDDQEYRLPTNLVPVTYTVTLKPYIAENNFTFDGTVDMVMNVVEATDSIMLHAKNLNIFAFEVTSSTLGIVSVVSNTLNEVTDILTLDLNATLPANSTVNLGVSYIGILGDDMAGFYRSSYTDSEGNTKWIAATQFQPTYARQAFPCFDEPALKATFNIRINRPEDLHAISNMPLASSSIPSEGRITDVFEETPIISTYLLAFIVSDFKSLINSDENFSVWARPNAIYQGEYALSLGPQLLAYFTQLTGHDYPLPKMDMAALSDFDWGAMENWGLVTYRETAMLYDENHSSVTAKIRVATVVAHELAHMWFGNIVTLKWWDYAWLNEGFARRFQYLATDAIGTGWNLRDQFLVEQHQVVFANDALDSAHALVASVLTPSEIRSHFSTITYNKGACIIKMIEHILGESVWHAALHEYISANLYGNVEPDDLWLAIQNQVDTNAIDLGGQSAKTVLDTWVLQAGYPVVTVNIDRSTMIATISQERFLLWKTEDSVTNLTWWVPITFTTGTAPDFDDTSIKYWLGTETATIQMNTGVLLWVVFNVQENGYYRVNYDAESWTKIINILNSDDLHMFNILNRAQIIDDLLNLARADYLSYKTVLEATCYFTREEYYIPWKALFNGLEYIDRRLQGRDALHKMLQTHVLTLIDGIYNKLGFDYVADEDWQDSLNRREILDWACKYGHPDCISKSQQYFAAYRANTTDTVSPNQRIPVYCTAIKHGTSDDWYFLWDQYAQANVAAEQTVILQTLGCSQNYTILYNYLHYLLEEERGIRPQDMSTLYGAVYTYGGLVGVTATLDFIRDYLAEIESYYGSLSHVSSMLSGVSLRVSTKELMTKYSTFIKSNEFELKSIWSSVSSQLARAQYESNWYPKHFNDISGWLIKQYDENPVDYRLPTTIFPESYDIVLSPTLEENNFTFYGEVQILAKVVEPTNEIVLHYNEITVYEVLVMVGVTTLPSSNNKYDSTTNKYTIYLETELAAGTTITISINYIGSLDEDMEGFYRSSYINADGSTSWLAATQFEPTYARQAFPCFDEPAFKATFKIRINRPQDLHAISNMPLAANSSIPSEGRITDVFEETPIMSTYLLAFIVSDFESLENSDGNFSVWARPNAIYQGEYALSLGPQLLAYFTQVTGHDYPLPKMDMVALSEFDWGAMENWGLVTYRETAMLYDENHSSATAKARVATVVAHELAHMWFGNIVTLKWWDYAWLNEGFARRFQYLATDAIETSWNLRDQFLVEQHQVVFANDALDSAHALVASVLNPSEIRSHFSTITYNKGASIIRMIESILGESVWHAALHEYISANLYGNVEPDDFWLAIQNQVDSNAIDLGGQSAKTVLDTWVVQAGYPVVTVNLDRSTGIAAISQERFLLWTTEDSVTNLTWWVPISFTTESAPDFDDTSIKYWLGTETATVQVNSGAKDWVVFNVQENGYYRVNYDAESWTKIINVLNSEEFETIHVLNRAQIIDDLLNLARADYVSYGTVLEATYYFTRETNYIPWKALFNGLEYIDRRLQGRDALHKMFQTHVLTLIDGIYNKLGFDDVAGEDWQDVLTRREILDWACKYGHPDCISKSQQYFAAYKANTTNTVSPNQRIPVYCTAIKHGTSDDWYFLWNQYAQANVAAEQIVILQTLGCSQNHTILYNYLHYLIEEEHGIRPQDMSTMYSAVYTYGGVVGVKATLDFIMNYLADIESYYGNLNYVLSILSGISQRLSTAELLTKYSMFIKANPSGLASIWSDVSFQLTLAEHESNWYSEHFNDISGWLIKQYDETPVDYRLPTTILPETYDISLSPTLEENNFKFYGEVQILANVVEPTSEIVLHYNEITAYEVLVLVGVTTLPSSNNKWDPTTHKFTIYLETELAAGTSIRIYMTYIGTLDDDMEGFYRSSYRNADGSTSWLATTQFEATYARQAFPCFDEPAFKAKFQIRVRRPDTHTSVSNMPCVWSYSIEEGYSWDSFEQSVIMPTYLVALLVSEFNVTTTEAGNFSVWARPEAISQAEYALDFGPKALTYLEEIFQLPYQLRKMDMAAIPDFSAGAMENWGLIEYRETRVLYDEDHSSAAAQQTTSPVIAHELLHSYFGNLVSPSWWNVIWLNEAFARYYQYFATAAIEPTWKFDQQFVVEQLQVVFATDALESSIPMTHNVSTPSEISSNFGTISYAKGASIVRMTENFLGSDVFLAALHDYLVARQYSTADPEDLWKALQGQIDIYEVPLGSSIEDILKTWTEQAGFPVVSVSIANGVATLTQERFLLRRNDASVTDVTWWVPITWATNSDPNFENTTAKYWLSDRSATVTVANANPEWIVFNVQESGFYRVNYDADSWSRIINLLNSESYEDIHELNRAAIVDDLLNLARAGYLDYETALDGLKYLTQETNYLPFKAAFTSLAYLNRRFAGQDDESFYTTHMLALIDNIYKKLGFEEKDGDDRFTVLLRSAVLSWACNFGHAECISKSRESFANWRANSLNIVPKNLRPAVYCTAIKYGTSEDWSYLYQEYMTSKVAAEQTVIITALGCSQNTTILSSYLDYATSGYAVNGIRRQDSTSVFAAVYGAGLFGAEYALDYVTENYESMAEYYGSYSSVASILSGISLRLSTQDLVNKFELLIENHSENLGSITSSLNSYLTLAKYELNWYNENAPAILNWLSKEYPSTSSTTDYRLPTNIVPKTYEMLLTPYIEVGKFTFDGVVDIVANVVTATNKIVLHADQVTWNNDDITVTSGSTEIGITNVTYSSTYHFLNIELASIISADSVLNIHIEYVGTLNTEMRGFYRSSYINDDGETRWLAATHLEPVAARRLFPCFDEPALKAKFIIHVNRPEDYNVLSNMPLNSSSTAVGGRVTDTFEQSLTMSTYLVAVIVSDFKNLTNASANFSVWARPNAIDQAAYALSVGPPLVTHLENLIDHKYQLPKLDMAALPDFTSGAMENWGLLTYRETRMLVDEQHTSAPDKQVIANVIAHEITHQWFGDLVSPEWWKYLWLNEGFARYYQYHATASVETSWGLESQFVVEQLQNSFASDGLTSTHAMSHDVWSPAQVRGIFDTISYAKAASVLRMMHKSFGATLFHNALHDYLEARQFDFATPEHLWEAFQGQIDASSFNLDASVKTIMDTWTMQAGFPVLNVTISAGHATLSQEKFILRNTVNASTEQTWWIPVTWTTQSDPQFTDTTPAYWLSTNSEDITVNDGTDEWIIFNLQESGYYRVNYDTQSWLRIINALKSDKFATIHEVNRASIIDDLFNLARIGYVDYAMVLEATQYLKDESNYIPWRAAFNELAYLNRRFAGTDANYLYKKHILTILDTVYENLGFSNVDGEDYFDTLLRRYVLSWACTFGHEGCIATSKELFAAWRADSSATVPVNQRSAVYCTAIKYGTSEDWEFLWQQYHDSNVATEHIVIISALGCSQNTTILHDYLNYAISNFSENGIRTQDSTAVFSSVYSAGLFGAEYVLDYVEEHHEDMFRYYGSYSSVATVLSGVALRLSTPELVDKFERFIENNNDALYSISSSLGSYLTLAKYELDWFINNSPAISKWLSETYEATSYRLPTNILPDAYDVYLTPYLEMDNFTFSGEVYIHMTVVNATSQIVLQANELTIEEISVTRNNVDPITVAGRNYNPVTHKLTLYFDTSFTVGTTLTVYIAYTGILNDAMQGFYRSSYKAADGTTHWIASTQFQPTHARRAFPCFDEPSFKAKFTINIETPADYHSISNMPQSNAVASDTAGRIWVSFEQSVTMSSYLVAFIVSDFESIENESGNFKVWARPNAVEHGEYALSIGQRVLDYLASYTDVAYPLAKMDMAAIPDFSAGAMENWGLVTYREYGLLSNENVTTVTYKKYINTIISHELVHMWFGDLVTCDWWDYTWLNEGFAQYYQFVAGDAVEPESNLLQQFVLYGLQSAMESDASASAHPMNNNVSTPSEISGGFDYVAYAKSASIIRMMQHSFGATTFATALHNYLEENQYKTVTPEKLWAAIQTQVDEDGTLGGLDQSVETVMNTWATQSGYPVINASLASGVVTLSQERFLLTRTASSVTNYNFWIPITYTTESNPDFESTSPKLWFGGSSASINLGVNNEWFILNVQEAGYYRVNYDTVSWSRLIAVLQGTQFETIHVLNRAQIIDDLLNLARSGYVEYSLALDATQYLKQESNHLPWRAFFNGLAYLDRRIDGQSIKQLLNDYVLEVIDKVYEVVGLSDVDGEGQLNELNRHLIVTSACNYGHAGCIAHAQTLFANWRNDDTQWITPNIRPAVYCTAVRYGSYEDWQFLWKQYGTTNFASEQLVILNALGCTRNATTLHNFLHLGISTDQGIRRQDSSTVFSAAYGSGQFGLEQTLDYLIEHYNDMYEYYGSWSNVLSIFSAVATRLSTEEQITTLEDFIANNPDVAATHLSSLASYVTNAKTNLQWYETNSPAIEAWLKDRTTVITTEVGTTTGDEGLITTTGAGTTTEDESLTTTTEDPNGGGATSSINIILVGIVFILTLALGSNF